MRTRKPFIIGASILVILAADAILGKMPSIAYYFAPVFNSVAGFIVLCYLAFGDQHDTDKQLLKVGSPSPKIPKPPDNL